MTEYNTYYLNNTGSRWVLLDRFGNKDKITLTTQSGKLVTRTCQFYEQFGNYATIQITYKGKRRMVFADTVLEDQMFPATASNEITYKFFCTLGGLSNPKVCKVLHNNGTHIYFTYHLLTVR